MSYRMKCGSNSITKDKESSKRPLRVSVVEPSGKLYGSEFALMEIIQGLNPSRYSFEVILPSSAPLAASTADGLVSRLPLLSPRTGTISRIHRLGSYLAVFKHWKKTRPDLIYVNQGGILRPSAMAARVLGIPLVCQVQR